MDDRTPRILIAKAGLDGHDRGARVIAAALRDHGFEVIYSGVRAPIAAIVNAAVQEGVDLIGLSVLSGAHNSLCRQLIESLDSRDARIPVVLGGIIPKADREPLLSIGIQAIFGPETPITELVRVLRSLAHAQGGPQ